MSKVLTTYVTHCAALYFDDPTPASGQTWPTLPPKVRTKAVCGGEPPARQTLNKTTSLPPSSFFFFKFFFFATQGRLTLATPPQLACSLWRGLSGGERASSGALLS